MPTDDDAQAAAARVRAASLEVLRLHDELNRAIHARTEATRDAYPHIYARGVGPSAFARMVGDDEHGKPLVSEGTVREAVRELRRADQARARTRTEETA